jgi:DDB1- and CUL4-associated factor 11
MVYNLEEEQKTCDIGECHTDDINSVCFANRNNSNILFTGSDDFIIKAWDRRIMEGNKPIGCFIGHREGVTCIDSRGDERYLASNGKDQTLKVINYQISLQYCLFAFRIFSNFLICRQIPKF